MSVIGVLKTVDTILGIATKEGEHQAIEFAKDPKNRHILYSSGSIIKLLDKFILEPTILVSNTVQNVKDLDKIIRYNMDLFSALYLQAFSVLTHIHNVDAAIAFDLLSSTKGAHDGVSLEEDNSLIENLADALEKKEVFLGLENTKAGDKNYFGSGFNKYTNYLEITINTSNNGLQLVIPVLVKANVIYSPFNKISDMIEIHDSAKTFSSRWDDYKVGAISLSDLIFATDLVKNYKKKRLTDEQEIIKFMEKRSRDSKTKLATSGALGFGKYYQMLIIDSEEQAVIENRLGGKITKRTYKDKFLEQINSLSLTSVDQGYERINIYVLDLDGYTTMSIKSLSKGKDSTDELADMLKNMLASRMI